MRKSRELLGLPVMDVAAGKVVGRVRQVVFSPEERRIAGFIIGGGLLRDKVAIRFSDVLSMGDDAVTVQGTAAIRKLGQLVELQKLATSKIQLYNTNIMTTTGKHLGIVDEILVSDAGEITHLVVSEGVFKDLVRRMKAISSGYIRAVGEDAVIVDAEALIVTRESGAASVLQRPTAKNRKSGSQRSQAQEKKRRWNGLLLIRGQPSSQVGEPSQREKEFSPAQASDVEANDSLSPRGQYRSTTCSKNDSHREGDEAEYGWVNENRLQTSSSEAGGGGRLLAPNKEAAKRGDRDGQQSEGNRAPDCCGMCQTGGSENDGIQGAQQDDVHQLEQLWKGTLIRAKDVTDRISRKVVYLRIDNRESFSAEGADERLARTQFSYIWEHWQRKLDSLKEGIDARGAEYLVGKSAATTIVDSSGDLIVNVGEVITDEIIERAKRANRLYHLALSAAVKDVDDRVQALKECFLPRSSQ